MNDNLFNEGISSKTLFFAGLRAECWMVGGGIVRVQFSTRKRPKRYAEAQKRAREHFKGFEVRPSWLKKGAARS